MNRQENKSATGIADSLGTPIKQKETVFLCCLSGEAVLEINDEWYSIQKGEVAIIIQGSYFRIENISENYSSQIITIPPTVFREHFLNIRNIAVPMASLTRYPVLKLQEKEQEDFITLANLCQRLERQKGNYQEKCLFNIYLSLIYFVCGIAQTNNTTGNINRPDTKERHYQHFMGFMHLLAQHCCTERNVKFYADKLFITPQYLSCLVKTISGRTALSWINQFVIAEAKQRIKFSGESIQEISYQLNFSDQSVFGKYFKRSTGMSPGSYKYQAALT